MRKILSIIVPTYNMELYLDFCLSSLRVDDRNDYEVIVVNDGSKDGSKSIAERFCETDPDVYKMIDKPNGNYGSCVNCGLAAAKGKYVKILDADDAFLNESFPYFLDFLDNVDVDLILSDAMTMDNSDKVVLGSDSSFAFPKGEFSLSDVSESDVRRIEHFYITYRRDIFDGMDYHQTEGVSYTDLEWDIFPMMKVSSVRFFPKPLYLYRMGRPGNTVSPESHCKNMWMERKVICGIIEKMVKRDAKMLCKNSFTDILLIKRAETVYFYHCVRYHSFLEEQDLIEFDTFIKTNVPALYMELESCYITVARIFHFKYIKEFRRRMSCKTWRYLLIELYNNSISFFKRIMH